VRGARFDGWFGSDPLCELPAIQIPDPDNPPYTIDSPDPNPTITVSMAEAAALLGDLSCPANFSAKILIVDGSDDDTLRAQYTSVLNSLGDTDYDEWSVRSPSSTSNPGGREEPTAADLANNARVIWYTDSDFAGKDPQSGPIPAEPSPSAEAALGQYLDGGGCLLLSSAEYYGGV
jgi:hypothetical protein